jgi:hypothetical protein
METRKVQAPVAVATFFRMPLEAFEELKLCHERLRCLFGYSRNVCREFQRLSGASSPLRRLWRRGISNVRQPRSLKEWGKKDKLIDGLVSGCLVFPNHRFEVRGKGSALLV